MADWNHSFDYFAFTPEEKEQLTDRLRQAAEQEERMKEPTKRIIRHTGRRLLIGAGAAAALTMGTLAATVGGGLLGYFEARTPEDQGVLEDSIYRLDRSESWNGWTVALTDCVGDDANSYVWVEVTAPEGTVLCPPEDGQFCSGYTMRTAEEYSGSSITSIPDDDPGDERISFCLELTALQGTLRGRTVDLTLDPIVDCWWSDPGTDRAVLHEGDVTGAIKDHTWVFEDVALNYPDQAVRLDLDVDIPYRDGTATLTGLEITPLTATVRIEGGSCYDHHGRSEAQPREHAGEIVIDAGQAGSITITDDPAEDISTWFECWDALEAVLVMKDGTSLPLTQLNGGSSCEDGVSNDLYEGVPYVEKRVRYAETGNPRVIDPSQVDHILVCGVRVELPD